MNYLKDILTRLQKYSATLDQSSFLVDKPWVVTNNDEKFEKLIFKRDGSVFLSVNGDVTLGKWEYLPEAQSLFIDYGNKKKLYQHQYLDEAVLALKIDGPDRGGESYYLMANENVIKNSNVLQHLERKLKLCGRSQQSSSKEDSYYLKEGSKNSFLGPYTPLALEKMDLENKLNRNWIVIPYKGQTFGMLKKSNSIIKVKDII